MKQFCQTILFVLLFVLLLSGNARAVSAGPRLTLSPASGSYTNGTQFIVKVGAETGDQKAAGVDIWATFDATKLEIIGIRKIANSDYGFAEITPNINNTNGTFTISFVSNSSSTYDSKAITGDLAEITFKGKAIGTASLNFTCSKDFADSNIITSETISTDLIDCGANHSGSYTITAGVGGETTTTTGTTPTVTKTLLKTGVSAPTVAVFMFGVISVLSAFALKWL